MYNDQAYQHEYNPGSLDDFIAQLLNDTSDILPTFTVPYASTSTSATTPTTAPVLGPLISPPIDSVSQFSPLASSPVIGISTATINDASPYLTCQWVSLYNPSGVCGTPLSQDPKHACMHLREAHHVRGNEKVIVQCHWRDCAVAPMQRGSLIRHVLTVHLGLLRWRCEVCRRMFSRRGTSHTCVEGV